MLSLQTERLVFRQWTSSDFVPFAKFFSDARNAEFVGGQKNKEESWRLMASYVGHFQLKGFSYLALEEKSTGQLVGTVGLWDSEPWPEPELGYWLLPEMQGRGFAFEAALKVIEFAFDKLKMATLVSYIDEANKPSVQLAERLGGIHDGGLELLSFGYHAVYRYESAVIGRNAQ